MTRQSSQQETTEFNIPEELLGDLRMLIPSTECFGDALGRTLERNQIYNVGFLVAATEFDLVCAKNIGRIRRQKIKEVLEALGLRHEMVDEKTSKLLFAQSLPSHCWMLKKNVEGQREADELVRKVFKIPPGVVPQFQFDVKKKKTEKKTATNNTETVTDLNIPKELLGDPRMLIPARQLLSDGVAIRLSNGGHLLNVGLMVAATDRQFYVIPGMGYVRIKEAKDALASLGLRPEMIDAETAQAMFQQLGPLPGRDFDVYRIDKAKLQEANALVRKAFKIPEDIVVPTYEETMRNAPVAVEFPIFLSSVFSAVLKNDRTLMQKAEEALNKIAIYLTKQELQRHVLGLPSPEERQPDGAVSDRQNSEAGEKLNFSARIPPIFSTAVEIYPGLREEITDKFRAAAVTIAKEGLQKQLDAIAPPTHG